VTGMLGDLLARAQRAGAIRADASLADVKALMSGCLYDDPTLAPVPPGEKPSGGAQPGGKAPGGKLAGDVAVDIVRRRVDIVCAGLLAR
jgi:hypothetical protein